jgi:hypothetical protein
MDSGAEKKKWPLEERRERDLWCLCSLLLPNVHLLPLTASAFTDPVRPASRSPGPVGSRARNPNHPPAAGGREGKIPPKNSTPPPRRRFRRTPPPAAFPSRAPPLLPPFQASTSAPAHLLRPLLTPVGESASAPAPVFSSPRPPPGYEHKHARPGASRDRWCVRPLSLRFDFRSGGSGTACCCAEFGVVPAASRAARGAGGAVGWLLASIWWL